MNKLLFSKSFNFNTFKLRDFHYTDNRSGCDRHYIGVMKKGRAKLVHKGGTVEIGEGDCFYIPINCSYRSFWYGEPKIEFDSFGFTHFPDDNEYTIQKICINSGSEIFKSVETGQNHSCLNIGRFYTALGLVVEFMDKAFKTKGEEIINNATEYFRANPNCKVCDVARYCGVSESALYNFFKEITGNTPNSVKQEMQIEKALTLLHSTDLKVETIAEKCGFCSAIYFRKVFKKVTGRLPSQMRKTATP